MQIETARRRHAQARIPPPRTDASLPAPHSFSSPPSATSRARFRGLGGAGRTPRAATAVRRLRHHGAGAACFQSVVAAPASDPQALRACRSTARAPSPPAHAHLPQCAGWARSQTGSARCRIWMGSPRTRPRSNRATRRRTRHRHPGWPTPSALARTQMGSESTPMRRGLLPRRPRRSPASMRLRSTSHPSNGVGPTAAATAAASSAIAFAASRAVQEHT
mmetsp:Transcript_115003/g.330349  ORF Transcript_115003/g.330349 Transcript_115003/m.330349 type:complete len:220 (+) Transcript_115003:1439-2098(+)